MKRLNAFFLFLFFISLFQGCKTTSQAPLAERARESELIKQILSQELDYHTLSTKVKVNLQLDEKKISLNGTLKIEKDKRIQLSFTFLLMEVARVEIDPNRILIINRMHSQYVSEPIEKLKDLVQTDMDYQTLQALLTDALFVPSKEQKQIKSADFMPYPETQTILPITLQLKNSGSFKTLFEIDKNQLVSTRIESKTNPHKLIWTYSEFNPIDEKWFPSIVAASFEGGAKTGNLRLMYSKIELSKKGITPSEISSKHTKIEIDELVKLISNL